MCEPIDSRYHCQLASYYPLLSKRIIKGTSVSYHCHTLLLAKEKLKYMAYSLAAPDSQ